MKLKLKFGSNEPDKIVNWWEHVTKFPNLITYKGSKYEFVMYDVDESNQVDYICRFAELRSYDPNWHATIFVDIEYLVIDTMGSKCECGANYTQFSQIHMFYCPLWKKI